ncbi:hypothetical protein [Acetobacter sp.]|uniref:hypothetical protein n=1 Tax=Acetobacter sp. TaxID=440 RepID=UPI0039E9529C
MRELTITEQNEVAGGCCWQPCAPSPCHPVAPSCGVSQASMIAAYAGFLAGQYNVMADLFNHASCSTVQQAVSNVCTDMQIGYNLGKSMTVSAATALLCQVTSEIKGAVTVNSCGWVTGMNLIDFPPSSNTGGLGA